MAFALVQTTNHGYSVSAATDAVSFASTTVAGNVVVHAGSSGSAPTSITSTNDKGDSATQVVMVQNVAHGCWIWAFVYLNPTAGSKVYTAHFNGANSPAGDEYVWEFSGFTSPATDKSHSGNGNSTSADSGATGTLSAASEVAVGYGFTSSGYTGAGTGWTSDGIQSVTGDIGMHQIVSSNASIDATGTVSPAGTWDMLVLTLQNSATGAKVVPVMMIGM